MKQAVVLALIAAAALAEEPGLSVRIELPAESLLEGERAVARVRLKNEGTSPIVLLDIEPDDGIETVGGSLSEPIRAAGVEVAVDGASIKVRSLPPETAQLPEVFQFFRSLVQLEPGAETEREVVFKAPTGHVYAVHFSVWHLSLDGAIGQGAVYSLDGQEGVEATYRRVQGAEAIGGPAILRIGEHTELESAHAAIAVEVKPREFSFAQAAQAAGVVPDAATWFEHRGLWALAAKGKTWLIGPETRIELHGDYVPLLSGLELAEKDTMAIPAQEDPFAGFLREKGATDVSGKGDGSLLLMQVKDLPEVLQKADELGFTVTQGGWKKRE